jgi:hypothetical protein
MKMSAKVNLDVKQKTKFSLDIMADCNKYVGRCRSLGYINDLYDMCKATCKFVELNFK